MKPAAAPRPAGGQDGLATHTVAGITPYTNKFIAKKREAGQQGGGVNRAALATIPATMVSLVSEVFHMRGPERRMCKKESAAADSPRPPSSLRSEPAQPGAPRPAGSPASRSRPEPVWKEGRPTAALSDYSGEEERTLD